MLLEDRWSTGGARQELRATSTAGSHEHYEVVCGRSHKEAVVTMHLRGFEQP
jgi:hypothetical protein